MKSLKRNLLALAIIGAPFAAQAELKPIDDAQMGSITGQAGVTIELETKVNIGEFRYTDEGSLAIKDISIGGAGAGYEDEMFKDIEIGRSLAFKDYTDLIDNIKIEIDVAADGDAIINVLPITAAPIDFGVTTGEWSLQGNTDSTLLASNFSMRGIFNKVGITVDTATDKLTLDTKVGISDLDIDVDFLAIGIRDLQLTKNTYLEKVADKATGGNGPTILDAAADIVVEVYKDQRFGSSDDSLAIDLQQFDADMKIGQVLVGGTSIGSLTLDNLSVQNTRMRIYGHQ
ncbi:MULTISPECIES: DUF6160 family protein [Marinobacter]|jgi:hypothetical protein|uniref:DUF6160 domain-containing protein n=3 Tax=Marinobacter nauticus TaxID=2743 RepID=A0A368UZI5_MARNT|nr:MULTISPECIES: DUF6160 family protein [Marinobacter]MAH32463.1 hypothetical protein [Marinobacter sp.]MEC8896917.1 DUF6160 family protein [Pseudomonadota bacterium]ABM19240.1 hypothetical protein Maqu_2161 [Marinobacter nauticus VT8]ERS11138.1 hypothetical protein Q673_11335 [Marinobacter sp. EN3]ERS83554.1 hypothetical protein Q667_18885 [Marinobacter sp. C1S70]|tara:strand:+ start:610 stop:1470 length:861 start_codon:yes stop_codon:yes gene_type:complete